MPFNTRHNFVARHDFSTSSNNLSSSNVAISSSTTNAVNGILRKANCSSAASSSMSSIANANEVRHVDLLVFGYACKVFRDDTKARDIDQGKHLIPWMGDNNLRIDRYDVRGALYDLTPYEPPPGGYGNRLDYLTAEEQRAEQLCEEERYLFLYNNEEDFITKQDEELKRLQQETNGSSYSQVGFSYDHPQQIGPNCEEFSNLPTCEEAEQPFQSPFNFQIPEGMKLPETMKQHAIIEKTARFIASQGVQMEILLKAKQSNNVQFEFLSQNSILNPYYRYVINSIKDGTYPQHTETKEKDGKDSDKATNSEPHVRVENNVAKAVVTVPTIKYKPSADCAYTQLISKIKGVPLSDLHDESSRQSSTSQQECANNSPSLTPVLLQYNGATFVTEHDDNSNMNVVVSQTIGDPLKNNQAKVEILKNSSALALAQNYSSDSETEDETAAGDTKEKTPPKLEFPLPPESLQNIIDKTAVYVIKNGRQFEETLRSKSVERFTFLLPDNEYYPYYMYKITDDPNAASKEQKKRKAKAVAEALLSKKGLNGDKMTLTANPVSFSIKAKDETAVNVALQQPALPQEQSDEEDKPKSNTSNSSGQRHVPEHVQKAIQLVESQLMARNAQLAATLSLRQPAISSSNGCNSNKTLSTRYEADKVSAKLTNPSLAATTSSTPIISKTEAERNALFEQQQQQRHKELKKAEEKVKDKLAQIAREKLGGLISKEKQLQLERKRKAMAFLNQIKGVSKTDNNSESQLLRKTKSNNEDDDSNNSDNSETSVHSIPITSYGPNSDDELDSKLENKLPTPIPPSPPYISSNIREITQQKIATINVSDDDEVELITESKPRKIYSKRRSRSRSREVLMTSTQKHRHYRKRTPSTDSPLYLNDECDEDEYEDEDEGEQNEEEHKIRRSKSKSHKSKKSKLKKSSRIKKKSKKASKSKSRTRSRSRSHSHQHQHQHTDEYRHASRTRSYTQDDYYKQATSSQHERHREKRKRHSRTPSRSNYSSRSHKDKRLRYD